MLTKIFGTIILLLFMFAIAVMIFGGFQIAIRGVEQDAEENMEQRAKELANQMYQDALRNTHVEIIQKVVVVDGEDAT